MTTDSDAVRRTWGRREWVVKSMTRRGTNITDVEVEELTRYQRHSIGPGNAATLFRSLNALDVRDVLAAIRVPTLVLHREDNQQYPVDHGRYLSENIEGAQFIVLPGGDPTWTYDDPTPMLDEIQEFLTGVRPTPEPDRRLATVLFTDVVGSTAKASELGDRKWRDILSQHSSIVEREVKRHAGRVINIAGEESLSTFDGPARAIRCAHAIRAAVRGVDLDVRAGLHTGEIEILADDIAGIAVHIGARVAALAGTGEVLVSSTVKDLVVGSGIEFDDRGTHELKGVPGDWRAPSREPKLPKTDTGIRTIGLDEETVRVLREHRTWSEELAQRIGFDALPARAYVFWPFNEGPLVPYAPQSITKMFRTLAGEGGLRPHQLRHFSVTQLLAAGVPEVEVMGRHGHASASSMKPYRHYIRARDRMSTEAMRDVLDGSPLAK